MAQMRFFGKMGLVVAGLLALAACTDDRIIEPIFTVTSGPAAGVAGPDPAPVATVAEAAYPGPTTAFPTKPAEALFQLVRPDGAIVNFAMADLKKLPLTSIMVGAKAEEGPALLEVLKAAGVTDFKQVTVSGDGSLTLTKAQITPQVVLDFSNRGTVKIAGPDLPIPSPAKDLTLIKVE
jgi:hypothetical protein